VTARALVAVAIVVLAVAGPRSGEPAHADTGRATDAQSGPGGVTVEILRWGGADHVRVSGGGGGGGCTYTIDRIAEDWVGSDGPTPPPGSGLVLGLLSCDGVAQRLVYYDPNAVLDVDAEARRVAERFVATVPVPRPRIAAEPDRGLAGIESAFALDGADDAPIEAALSAFGVAVDVRIVPSAVTWGFGDGSATVGGFTPAGHLFTERSTRAGPEAGFTVTAAYRLGPAYRIAGGPWLPLPDIPVGAHLSYVVHDAQAVIG
jgi:hypothetical protein